MRFEKALYSATLLALLVGVSVVAQADLSQVDSEAFAKGIERDLIAPCCWTQTIAEHRSEAAEKMRQELREMIRKGASRQQILDFFIARHGERILAAPRPRGFNLAAYILPGLGILAGAGIVASLLRRWKAPFPAALAATQEKDREYLARIERELGEKR